MSASARLHGPLRLSAARRLRVGAALLGGFLLAVGIAPASFAANATPDSDRIFVPGGSSQTDAQGAKTASSLTSMSLVLGVGLAAAGGWLVWRNRRSQVGGRDLRALAIDETRSLGNRQFLVVASYEGKKFLLGVCPGRIDMLTPLGDGVVTSKPRE